MTLHKISPGAAQVISRIVGKLTERSSVLSYVLMLLAVAGINNQGLALQLTGIVVAVAGIVCFALTDKTFSALFVASTPQPIALQPLQHHEVMTMSVSANSIFAKLQAVAALLPLVTQLIQQVDAAMPGFDDATKLNAVRDALDKAYATEQSLVGSFDEIWPMISAIVSSLAASFKQAA
ncbi:hypothetical protein [Xanthomonas sp. MUS 060]|uniref:hypothetical protein n=1 Tax=Xanthomonas sp. MUS 060 TaxID=1588031 RepID=UPI0005F2D6EB|nr:hypothetical protein [Xanthomonas sp. MUS 060]